MTRPGQSAVVYAISSLLGLDAWSFAQFSRDHVGVNVLTQEKSCIHHWQGLGQVSLTLNIDSIWPRHYNTVRPPKKLYTFEMVAEYEIYNSGKKVVYVWKAHKLSFHMTPRSPKIIHARVMNAYFCKGYEN